MTTLRQPALPAASTARTVTELFPTRSGIVADQAVVPAATPAVPKLVAQETSVTPTLSLAVPAMVTEAAVVDMVPVDGVVMVNAGGVMSGIPPPEPAPGPVVVADCRVMVTDFAIRLAEVDAVMVMVFAPVTSGRLTILQADAGPAAIPEVPLIEDHVTVMTPVLPDADPDKLTLDEVVVEATAFTVKARAGVGAGVGGGTGAGAEGGTAAEVGAA
jgi:hypothetical protein